MTRRTFQITSMTNPVERITVETGFTFDQLVAGFEKQLGRYDLRTPGALPFKRSLGLRVEPNYRFLCALP